MIKNFELADRIIDLHEDISCHLMTEREIPLEDADLSSDMEGRQADLPKYRKAGIAIVIAAIFPLVRTLNPYSSTVFSRGYEHASLGYVPRSPFPLAIEQLKIYYRLAERFRNHLSLINSRHDLEECIGSRQLGFLMCLEGAEALEDSSDLEVFFRLGVRALGITWNHDNRYGSSCMSKRDYGLTGEGERLVTSANEMGVIIDLAHSGKTTTLEALSLSRRPAMISHSNYQGVHEHARNVDDEVLEALTKNNGIVGFTMINETIGPEAGLEGLAQHILAVRDRFGPDILAIGTDYLGIDKTPRGLGDITKLMGLLDRLSSMGLRDEEIRKLAWKNAYKVLTQSAQLWK